MNGLQLAASGSHKSPAMAFCEQRNDPFGFVKGGGFFARWKTIVFVHFRIDSRIREKQCGDLHFLKFTNVNESVRFVGKYTVVKLEAMRTS
jgi:hypothetical protein